MTQSETLVYSAILSTLAKIAAGNHCQCVNPGCGHAGPCNAIVEGDGWRARYRVALSDGGADSLGNCEVVCLACHERSAADSSMRA